MLRKVGESAWPISEKDAVISIKDASYPIPFPQGLEFNSPAHGCWNIVHTGMLIPEAHQIYVCADNCMRGVVLTAAEMCEEDRFSFVIVEEQNLLSGNLEDVTIEGTADILRKLKEREEKTGQKMPKAVLLFTVCLHHFVGCDLERIYRELEQRFPEIRFLRCYMDPIMQKHGPTPDQKLRKAMYEPLNPDRNKMDTKQISILGSDFALDLSCDLKELLAIAGYKVRELQDCSTWEEYEELGNAGTFLCCYPSGKYGIETLAERLRRAFLYLPLSFDYEEIRNEEETLWNSLGVEGKQILSEWMEKKITLCEEALNHAKQIIGNAPITIDYTFHPRPLGLARLLLIHGFNVKTVFLDSISPEEKEVFEKKMKLANCKTMSHFLRKCVLEKEIYVVDLEPFRNLQWLLSNATNNINQIAKATNTTGVIYKNEIESMNKQIEKLSKEIWQIHSLLLNKSKESSGD